MNSLYFTYGEPPSGVYSGQVCDVVNHLNKEFNAKVRLVAFISLQQFSANRKKIRKECSNAIVFPMLPKAEYWRLNIFWLWLICLFTAPRSIIARNVIASNMALSVKKFSPVKKVCFDGRGAIAAEWEEYDVKVYESWKKEIAALENKAVNNSGFRIAVSSQLVHYWKERYHYQGDNHVVIPCTVSSRAGMKSAGEWDARKALGYTADDLILAYSGSAAGWQSFTLVRDFLKPLLQKSGKVKVLFLAKNDTNIESLQKEFPGQVQQQWLAHDQVVQTLGACDYGILVREETVTNRVASPTKFAEYLSAGLPVIISANLGDYTAFVNEHHCGIELNGMMHDELHKPDEAKRQRMKSLVESHFTKKACARQYQTLAEWLK